MLCFDLVHGLWLWLMAGRKRGEFCIALKLRAIQQFMFQLY